MHCRYFNIDSQELLENDVYLNIIISILYYLLLKIYTSPCWFEIRDSQGLARWGRTSGILRHNYRMTAAGLP